jgi:nitrogen fixation/metabolism regulation signal transduction histidine kinase
MGRVTLVLEVGHESREVFRGVDVETVVTRRSVSLRALDGKPRAQLSVEVPPDRLQRIQERLLWLGGALVLFALAWALTIGPWFARRITEPVLELAHAATRVTEGDLSARVRERGKDELAALIHAFNQMVSELATGRDRIARAERLATWREAAQRIAHEIKNPLFPMQMAMETLRKAHQNQHPKLDEIVKESTQAVLDEVRSLSRLVSEFSEFARLPKPVQAEVPVLELLEQAARIRSDEAVELSFDRDGIAAKGLPPLLGDQDLLARALSNLVKNAEEAQSGRTDARIELYADLVGAPDAPFVRITVQDHGPGIPEDLKDRVFTPYFTTKSSGTGLGLAIVERIVIEHGGQVDVNSSSSGTGFQVTLPAAPR